MIFQSFGYKACLKWLSMTCHKSCGSRHGKKDAWDVYIYIYITRSRVYSNGTEPEKELVQPGLKSIGNMAETFAMYMMRSKTAWETRKPRRKPKHCFITKGFFAGTSRWSVVISSQFMSSFVGNGLMNGPLPPHNLCLGILNSLKQRLTHTL